MHLSFYLSLPISLSLPSISLYLYLCISLSISLPISLSLPSCVFFYSSSRVSLSRYWCEIEFAAILSFPPLKSRRIKNSLTFVKTGAKQQSQDLRQGQIGKHEGRVRAV
jgi:hypothetical protein